MKIALRDDDLNYFFNPGKIENNCKGIWDICPISMSVVPFMMGNWLETINLAERIGPGVIEENTLDVFKSDTNIYPLGNNIELVSFIKQRINDKKIALTFHGINHRNHDSITPQFKSNYGIGAEFFTNIDLTEKVSEAVSYIEELFSVKIRVFTPPQNLFSKIGIKSIIKNNLNICAKVPSIKNIRTVVDLGYEDFLKLAYHKYLNRKIPYPGVLKFKNVKIVEHISLQPGTNLTLIKDSIDFVSSISGKLVISTHSWGFNYKMKGSNQTMGEALLDLLEYAMTKSDVEFVTLNDLFE